MAILKKKRNEYSSCVRRREILLKQKILPLFCEDGHLFMLEPVMRDEMEEEERARARKTTTSYSIKGSERA